MNIFVTNLDPVLAAQDLCDEHIQKMYIESVQVMSGALYLCNVPGITYDAVQWKNKWSSDERMEAVRAYKPTHLGHPCTLWTKSKPNYMWLHRHSIALCDEFELRFGKQPVTRQVLDQLPVYEADDPKYFVQCMPDGLKCDDVVQAYRAYYKECKPFASWSRGRAAPSWFTSDH